MKKVRFRIDFTRLGYQAFADRFVEIIQALIANLIIFNNLEYTQAQLENFASHIATKTNKAKKGSDEDRQSRNVQYALCIEVLFKLMYAVLVRVKQEETYEAQIAIATLSKFTLAKVHNSSAPPVQAVTGVQVAWIGEFEQGNELEVSWDKAEGALFYRIQTSLTSPSDPNCVWKDAANTSHKSVIVKNQPSLSRVWVRVISYGKNATTAMPSEEIMCRIG